MEKQFELENSVHIPSVGFGFWQTLNGTTAVEVVRCAIEAGEEFHFVEIMACPGGCAGGGGQPIHDGEELAFARGRKLYALDAKADIRYSHENPDIREIYSDFFGKPMSHKAHMLLHTEHWKNN